MRQFKFTFIIILFLSATSEAGSPASRPTTDHPYQDRCASLTANFGRKDVQLSIRGAVQSTLSFLSRNTVERVLSYYAFLGPADLTVWEANELGRKLIHYGKKQVLTHRPKQQTANQASRWQPNKWELIALQWGYEQLVANRVNDAMVSKVKLGLEAESLGKEGYANVEEDEYLLLSHLFGTDPDKVTWKAIQRVGRILQIQALVASETDRYVKELLHLMGNQGSIQDPAMDFRIAANVRAEVKFLGKFDDLIPRRNQNRFDWERDKTELLTALRKNENVPAEFRSFLDFIILIYDKHLQFGAFPIKVGALVSEIDMLVRELKLSPHSGE